MFLTDRKYALHGVEGGCLGERGSTTVRQNHDSRFPFMGDFNLDRMVEFAYR